MKLFTRKPTLDFLAGARTAPSGVTVRTVDVVGVPAQELHDAVEHAISEAFDLRIHDRNTLRIEFTDTRMLATADIVFLPDHVRRAAHAAGLIR